jgi:fumarate hydratase class I
MNAPAAITSPYKHTPLFPLGPDSTRYRKLGTDGVRVESVGGRDLIVVEREALRALAEAAFGDINHLLRPGHLKQLRTILDDPQASDNDRFVAYDFLKNANIAAGGVLPMCQDTGTAIIMGKKGRLVFTDGDDEAALAEGARDAYLKRNLRYSQLAPISMFEEKNTRSNMPAQIEIYAEGQGENDGAYKLLFIAKGGGSANKSFLFQATPSILTHDRRLPQGEGAHARHRRVSAVSPLHRHRRHLGRAHDEDGEARLLPLSRRSADARLRGRPCVPRPRHGAGST